MRCVSADRTPSSWPALLGMPFSLRVSRHEGSADTFAWRAGDPGLNHFGKSNATGFVQQHRYRKDFMGTNCDCGLKEELWPRADGGVPS